MRLGHVSAHRVLDDQAEAFLSRRLRSVVLLAGGLRPAALQRAAGRCLLEMPVEPGRTVQTCWSEQLCGVAEHLHLNNLPVRVLIDRQMHPPNDWVCRDARIGVSIERDPYAYRGTGGLLRDVVCDYDDDDYVLVADAGQLLFTPLWSVLCRLSCTAGDVRLLARGDGSPAGLMLVRCGPLRDLPAVGFVDFKEQGLPRLAASYAVRVTRWRGRVAGCATPTPGLPLRHVAGYMHALRVWAAVRCALSSGAREPEPWCSAFSLVEPGAEVNPTAMLHDTVVLDGGRVEAHAALVRCVVGPGGCVPAGRTRTDALIVPPDRLRGGMSFIELEA